MQQHVMDAISIFQTFTQQFPDYEEGAFELIIPHLKVQQLKKGEHLLNPGNISREIAFVTKGLLRVYYLKNGHEVTTCFCKEERFTTSYKSLISQQPSELGLQVMEDSELITISYEKLSSLYTTHPFWQQIGRMVTEQEYLLTECYTRMIHDKSAKERYLEVLDTEPDLLQRISLATLASYLQVSPETISRIRRELATS